MSTRITKQINRTNTRWLSLRDFSQQACAVYLKRYTFTSEKGKILYYWNSTTLAKELILDNLTEWEKAKYFLASLFFQMLSSVALAYLVGFSTDEIGVFSYFVAAIIIYFSVVKIFKFVSELESTSFIEALIVLGFPALVKVTVGFWIMYFALLIAYGTFGASYFLLQVFHALFAPVYYWAFFNIIYNGLVRANV